MRSESQRSDFAPRPWRVERNRGHWLIGLSFRGPQTHVYLGWWVVSRG